MGTLGAAGGLSAGAKAGIAIASVVAVVGAGGIAFAVTGGFGLLDQEPSADDAVAVASASAAPAATEAETDDEEIVPGERAEDGDIEEPSASGMQSVFDKGNSVECHYTYKAYDATTTMRSMTNFRLDQRAQGGMVHVIRDEPSTLVWVEGMIVAEEWNTDEYDQQSPDLYPNFNPVDFDVPTVLDPDVCVEIPQASDELFTLPADMSSAPATP